MDIHNDTVYKFATTDDPAQADELLNYIAGLFGSIYADELVSFADRNDIDLSQDAYTHMAAEFGEYVISLLKDMRKRCMQKKGSLKGLTAADIYDQLYEYVLEQFERIEVTETSNALQLAEYHAILVLLDYNGDVTIRKRWRAHPDCCEICAALDGVEVDIDEYFLVNGQVVEMADGKEFIYKYIDRSVCIAHPNDRCWIEFVVYHNGAGRL